MAVVAEVVGVHGLDTWPLLGLELLGVFVFALSGALLGVRKRFDVIGVVVLAVCAGLGGGILRDVLIGSLPPVGIRDARLVGVACAAGVLTFWLHPRIARIERLVLVLDAFGLALFAVAGTVKALDLGSAALTAVIVGVLTGVGGGAIRDLLAGEVPRAVGQRELYVTPALLGAVAYAVAWSVGLGSPVTTWVCVALAAAVRLVALRRNWQAPAPRLPGG